MFRKTIVSVLFLCVLPLLAACGAKNEIAGCWKAELSVLGFTEGVSTAPEDNYILLYFNEDLSGKNVLVRDGQSGDEMPFSYSLSDGRITITREDGQSYAFEYLIDSDILTLKEANREAQFTKYKG